MTYEEASRQEAAALRDRARKGEPVRILALETSCDETAAAVVENGRRILSNIVFSQIDLHELYGGVVPEIASRAHMEACDRVVDEALKAAGMHLNEIDALAVTKGPGLVGALLTGVNCMKGLAFAAGKPLIGVNHIEGHVSANYLSHPALEPPFLCLVVSGGHSHLVSVEGYGVYRLLGQTADDAAGEAFDKAARVLGLPYPGGPRIDALAEEGDPEAFRLPRPKTEGPYDYSFSGMKTAFLNLVNQMEMRKNPEPGNRPGESGGGTDRNGADRAAAPLPKADLAAESLPKADLAAESLPKADRAAESLPKAERASEPLSKADRAAESLPKAERASAPLPKADLAASFRRAVCEELVGKARRLIRDLGSEGRRPAGMALAGGVSANRELRRRMTAMCREEGIPLYMPEIRLCTDNGAMIASAAYYRLLRGETAPLAMNAEPALRLV